MTQPFLTVRNNSSVHANVAVFKEINMQLSQVGTDFGTTEHSTPIGQPAYPAENRALHWQNDLYCVNYNTLYKWDTAANGPWAAFYAFTSPDGAVRQRCSPTACSIDGVPYMVTGYSTNTTTFRLAKIDKAGAGSLEPATTRTTHITSPYTTGGVGLQYHCFGSPISYRNSIAWVDVVSAGQQGAGAQYITVYDLKTNTATSPNAGETLHAARTQLCVHKDKIYATFVDTATSTVSLWRVDGGVLTNAGSLGFTNTYGGPSSTVSPSFGLVSLNDKMYALFLSGSGSNGTWKLIEVTIDSTTKDITSTVDLSSKLPSAMTSLSSRGEEGASFRVDNLTNTGDPILEIQWGGNRELDTISLYRWGDIPTGNIIFVDAGLDGWRYCRQFNDDGTSDRVWSGSGTINASAPTLTLAGSNITAEFTVHGASQSGISAHLLYTKESNIVAATGTIASTDVGSVDPDGKTITGLTADNTTAVTVSWEAALDGITSGDNPKVAIRVFI